MLADKGIGQMYLVRADRYIIIFLYSEARQEEKLIHDCAVFLSGQLNEISRFFVSVGPVVSGMERAHISYMEAKEHLKQSFFHEYGFILDKDTVNAVSYTHLSPGFSALQELFYYTIKFYDIILIDFPDIANPEGVRVRHLARIDGISPFLYIMVHFLKGKAAVLWVEKGGDDGALIFPFNIWTDTKACQLLNQKPVIACIPSAPGLNPCLSLIHI